jgi:multicomponent Na+:H+ antiporter subunit A
MELIFLCVLPFFGALISPILVRVLGGKWAGVVLSVVPFSIAAWLLARAQAGNGVSEWSHPWLPALGVELALRLDGTATLFLVLVSVIGGLICIYGGSYLAGDRQISRFFGILLVFMASMLGIILADDVILTFVFWELTSVTSFLLVGYKHEDEAARKAALQALLVTGGGGLALLAGLLLTVQITGTTRISEFSEHAGLFTQSALFLPALCLILLGVSHQVRASAISLLAARCDVGTHAGECLSSLGDDGEGRGDLAGEIVTCDGADGALVLADRTGGSADHGDRRRDGCGAA